MGVALAAIADDGDLLALDQVQIGVAIVVNAHLSLSLLAQQGRPAGQRASKSILWRCF
jgi:hypothetical protein